MKYKAVLYDMDGTVLDSLTDLKDSMNAALRHFNMPEITLSQASDNLGNGARVLVTKSLPAGTEPELVEKVLEYYLPWYADHCMIKTGPYDGIPDMLDRLNAKGLRQVIVSNKPDVAAQEISERFFSDKVEFSMGEREGIRRKPWPDMVFASVSALGLEVKDCVYVGDTEVDLETARNAGMDCITVTWGFRSRQQLADAGAYCFADTPEQLERMLLA